MTSQFSTSISTKVQNIDFLDQRINQSEVAVNDQIHDNSVSLSQTITESPWQISSLLTRYVLFSNFTWLVSDAISLQKLLIDYPADLPTGFPQAQILDFMTYFRAGVSFKFMVNGMRFHQGRLLASWYPARNTVGGFLGSAGYTSNNYMSNLPHVEIAPDSGESAILTVPYSHIYSMWNQFQPNSLGQLSVAVLNQLQAGTGATQSVSVSVYVKLVDPEVHVPIVPQNPVLRRNLKRSEDDVGLMTNSLSGLQMQGGFAKLGKAAISGAKTAASYETGDIGGVITGGLSTIENAVSGIGDIINGNFDLPNERQESTLIVRNTMTNPSIGSGIEDASMQLGLYHRAVHGVPKQYLSTMSDDMVWSKLSSKFSFVETHNWLGSNLVGDSLYATPVCPSLYAPLGGTNYTATWLTFVASKFMMWRGSIKFRLEFVGTQFHSGRLLVAFVPNQYANLAVNTSSTLQAIQNCPHVVWDVREKHELFIECPFDMNLPYLYCPTPQEWNKSGDGLSVYPLGARTQNSCSGTLHVRVLNELTNPADAVPNAQINVWVAGGDGLNFHKLRGNYEFVAPFNQQTLVPAVLQVQEPVDLSDLTMMSDVGDDSEVSETSPSKPDDLTQTPQKLMQDEEVHVLQKSDSVQLHSDVGFFGYPDIHMKDHLRRSVMISSSSSQVFPPNSLQRCFAQQYIIPVIPTIENHFIGSVPPFDRTAFYAPRSFLGEICSAFAFWGGGLKYKIVVSQNVFLPANPTNVNEINPFHPSSLILRVAHAPDVYGGPAFFSNTGPASPGTDIMLGMEQFATYEQAIGVQPCVEINVPWSQPNSVALTNYTWDQYPVNSIATSGKGINSLSNYFNGSLLVQVETNSPCQVRVDIWMGVADDFFLTYSTSPPPVSVAGHTPQ